MIIFVEAHLNEQALWRMRLDSGELEDSTNELVQPSALNLNALFGFACFYFNAGYALNFFRLFSRFYYWN